VVGRLFGCFFKHLENMSDFAPVLEISLAERPYTGVLILLFENVQDTPHPSPTLKCRQLPVSVIDHRLSCYISLWWQSPTSPSDVGTDSHRNERWNICKSKKKKTRKSI